MTMMNDLEISLMFKGMSHILANQERILRRLGEEENGNFYNLEDTNTLSVKFGQLAQKYYKKHNPDWTEEDPNYSGA
jgi:hypothetical protein